MTVSRWVAVRRRELGLDRVEVFVPQAHVAGAEAEVDFGEFHVRLAGADLKVWMFAMRLSASGKAFHHGFANQAQEAFLEGHVRAFAALGGVPARVRYDNLKPAVVRILKGRDRVENDRFTALRSHYGFESFFCVPGKDGAHEKGGIEGEIVRFRRTHLVPVPDVASMAVLNDLIGAGDVADDARVITGHKTAVGVEAAAEACMLMALPGEPFDAATLLTAKVDSRSRVCVRQAYYSVPPTSCRPAPTPTGSAPPRAAGGGTLVGYGVGTIALSLAFAGLSTVASDKADAWIAQDWQETRK
ncbi:hypothetical protein [Xylanimonas sp. McL0601]|uniref:hypothetical protein n=1 Tax=Xylanimonas sp. McL0601 TaxID=3414739 RepID=UPI003CF84CDD